VYPSARVRVPSENKLFAQPFGRDIDCAFPSRDDAEDEDEEPVLDKNGKPIGRNPTPPRSAVTLSGLLNVLDSVSSEEGRLTFATVSPASFSPDIYLIDG
jgi:hypothetical protein